MNTYTLNGDTYYACGGLLYEKTGKVHSVEEIENNGFYLYPGDESLHVCQIRNKGEIFSTVTVRNVDSDYEKAIRKSELPDVEQLRVVVPDNIHKCPECGHRAGSKDAYESPVCYECGVGVE